MGHELIGGDFTVHLHNNDAWKDADCQDCEPLGFDLRLSLISAAFYVAAVVLRNLWNHE